ncbi:MAG TPA: hypothetical protein VNW92_08605, partial [Polyangiaceae bacterium]|nr:hypothetical protein [Polyangiaceae bacterium]
PNAALTTEPALIPGPGATADPRLMHTTGMPNQLGIGLFFGFIAAVLALGAFVFIWFGVFPGLVLLLLCIPTAMLALHFIRRGRPAGTA